MAASICTTEIASLVACEREFSQPIFSCNLVANLGVTIEQYRLSPNEAQFAALPSHLITWNLGESGDLTRIEGSRLEKTLMMRGGATLTPAGQPRHWYWNHSPEVLMLQIQPEVITQIAIASEIDVKQAELMSRFGIYDSQMEFFGKALLAEMQSDGFAGQLYTESLINLLVIHMLRKHSILERPLTKFTNRFSASRFQQVIDYIHENLEQSISLADLASLANLSPSQFIRGFRQETGLSPHQYLIRTRIEKAKNLLRSGSNLSISSVAHRVGFADQSHFTRHFKRLVGVTPKTVLQDSKKILNYGHNIQD